VILDFISKHIIRAFSPDMSITSFFSISFIKNTGGAFGLLRGYNWIFIIASIIVIGIFICCYINLPQKLNYIISLSLFLGGAVGNLIDRVFFGYVTDFIAFSFWPAFNIADAAILVGVIWLAILLFIDDKSN